MRDEIMGAQEEAYRLHELRQGAVSELSRLRYAEEELVQVDILKTHHTSQRKQPHNTTLEGSSSVLEFKSTESIFHISLN